MTNAVVMIFDAGFDHNLAVENSPPFVRSDAFRGFAA
jgi:hypothetical protein